MPAAMANPLLVSSALGTSISRGDCDALVGAAIEKWFPPDQGAGFAGGCLKGKVVAWDQIVEDENGRTYEGPFFHVR